MPWPLPSSPEDRLALATGYPYEAPPRCFLFRGGGVAAPEVSAFADRHPVLAHGSNRAPAQLARKFGDRAGREGEVPVTYAWLTGYDVVYSAHVSRYGAVASTLHEADGCRVRVALTWLTEGQLSRMHETEGDNYPFGRLAEVELHLESGPADSLGEVATYLSRHGALADAGRPVGLAALTAEGRRHRALAQLEVQQLVRDRHHPGEPLERHILANIADAARRTGLTVRLRAEALPTRAPHFRPANAREREPG